ncbi:MAG: sigma 54-interacting transcriptional regulator [Desulfobacterales bacterium]|nr:MAG: sigma 54-interacting transcriptional regulator [Desulfobacterales bacterium]
MRRQSLKTKLLTAVFALVIGSCVLISLLVTNRYGSSLFKTAAAQAENIAHAIALEATEKILINDLANIQKTLDYHLRSNAAVAYLFIVRDGQILAHTFSNGVPVELIPANIWVNGQESQVKKIISTMGDPYLDIAWPIFSGKAGVLRLGLSEKPYQNQVTRLWFQIAAITLAILFLAIGLSLLFVRRITRPLASLAEAAEKIDKGRLDVEIVVGSHDEVGKLAVAFQNMILRIKGYTQQLEEKNLEVDRAHQQTRASFVISQEINALPKLNDVCAYLIRKLLEVVACERLVLMMFSGDRELLLGHDGQRAFTLGEAAAESALKIIGDDREVQFVPTREIDTKFLSEKFLHAENLAVFPMYHENILLGAMFVACPGECHCFAKELDVIDMILNQASGAIRRAILHEEEIRELRTRVEPLTGFCGIIGKDPQMHVIYKMIDDIAPTDATVLIQGESGTGKELVARAIHLQSLRRDKPFVVINCSAYPTTLLESELFGHEKGAFTGAVRQKCGRFEQADGGTVFLDEVGEIAPSAQIKLLRVLQSQKFERVGGEKSLTVNVRILAATNKDLLQEVKKGQFREDLFYRLNVIPIDLPPLRERRNDIPLLARCFLQRFAAEQGKQIQDVRSEAMRRLLEHAWPGNVRELENSIEHATVLAKSRHVEVSDLPQALQRDNTALSFEAQASSSIRNNEIELLKEVMEKCGWNKKEATLRLGISRSTLYRKLQKYKISQPTIH